MPYNPTPQTITDVMIDAIKADINSAILKIQAANTTNVALTKDERKRGVTVARSAKDLMIIIMKIKMIIRNLSLPTVKPLSPKHRPSSIILIITAWPVF